MTDNSLVGVELETGGVLLKFLETSVETNGLAHIQEARYPPHSEKPPLHRHPRQTERFTIIEGALRFHVGDAEKVVAAGDSLDIAKGVMHYAFNPFDTHALVIWETRPALRSAEFYYAMGRAARGRHRTLPRLVDAAAILSEYRDVFELARPSPFVQRIVFGCLAPFARSIPREADRKRDDAGNGDHERGHVRPSR
jgi:quercetin dioxygenase-like cupin family protein